MAQYSTSLNNPTGQTAPTQLFINIGSATSWVAPADGLIIYLVGGLGDWGSCSITIGTRSYSFQSFGNTEKGGWVTVAKGETVNFSHGSVAQKQFFYTKN